MDQDNGHNAWNNFKCITSYLWHNIFWISFYGILLHHNKGGRLDSPCMCGVSSVSYSPSAKAFLRVPLKTQYKIFHGQIHHTNSAWKKHSNSLAPGKFEWNFRHVIFKQILVTDGLGISCEMALIWVSPLPEPMLIQIFVAIWHH